MASANHVSLSERLSRQIITWCGVNGLLFADGNLTWTPAPVSLFPKKLSREHFQFLLEIQPIWNKLIDRIARDRPFLQKELEFVCQADPFTARVMKIYESLTEEEIQASYQLGILRSDYMIDAERSRALQIEINTIASSFGSLSKRVNLFQEYFLQRNQNSEEMLSLLREVDHSSPPLPRVESHESLFNIASALAAAHKVYCQSHSLKETTEAVVLFIVQPNERNLADQRLLEQEVWRLHQIPSEFVTLRQVHDRARVDGQKRLFLSLEGGGEAEVAVAYYRSGYSPQDYPGEEEWAAREVLERSKAIKCPSAGYHLAGCKAVQAALFKPRTVERFLNEEESRMIRDCFAEQYSLGDRDLAAVIPQAIQRAIDDEGRSWVLKPQREGGGNNYYGERLQHFLQQHRDQSLLEGFVLMRRIFPEVEPSVFFKRGEVLIGPSVSELGIYGCILFGQEGEEVMNNYAGYLLRTKAEGVDEGGVATGYSVPNALTLV